MQLSCASDLTPRRTLCDAKKVEIQPETKSGLTPLLKPKSYPHSNPLSIFQLTLASFKLTRIFLLNNINVIKFTDFGQRPGKELLEFGEIDTC